MITKSQDLSGPVPELPARSFLILTPGPGGLSIAAPFY